MSLIYHITTPEQWEAARRAGSYRGDTLETEGFIHCSTGAQVARVGDAFYAGRSGLLLLCIESEKVIPAIRSEGAEGGEKFPHIYGPLNVEAVVKVTAFEPGPNGGFQLPEAARAS